MVWLLVTVIALTREEKNEAMQRGSCGRPSINHSTFGATKTRRDRDLFTKCRNKGVTMFGMQFQKVLKLILNISMVKRYHGRLPLPRRLNLRSAGVRLPLEIHPFYSFLSCDNGWNRYTREIVDGLELKKF